MDKWTPEGWVPADWAAEYIANFGSGATSEEITAEEAQEWVNSRSGAQPQPVVSEPPPEETPEQPSAVEALKGKVAKPR